MLEREKIRRLKAVGEVLKEFSCAEGKGEAENNSKATASDTAKVTARPGIETRR